jgi:prepilin-type N-terminal cleavage/methylation domain-containing protein
VSNHSRHQKAKARALACRALTFPRSVPTMTNDAMRECEPARLFASGSANCSSRMFETPAPWSEGVFDIVASPPRKMNMISTKKRGFSLLEMLVVISIGLIMAGVTFMAMAPLFKENHVDQAYDTTLSVMRNYRNQSITSNRRYIIVFTAPRTITVQWWQYVLPPGVSPAPVVVATYTLPSDIQFAVQGGFPNPGPDGFGTGVTPIAFNACAVVEGGNPCIVFFPDGSAQDDVGNPGNFNSGVVYLTRPGDIYSSRAIDVWGATGRIRGWRLYLVAGVNTWVQQ